jgi:signal peptidase
VSRLRTTAGWIGQVAAWTVILAAVAILALAVLVPRLGGATPYTVLTGSMRPAYPPGTLVVVRPVRSEELAVGDVITYQLRSGEPTVVTHRVVATGQRGDGTTVVQTQGDANDVPDDPWVMPVQVKGRLWYAVPYLGRLNALLTGEQHQVLVLGAAAGLGGYALVMFAAAMRERGSRPRGGRRRAAGRTGREVSA